MSLGKQNSFRDCVSSKKGNIFSYVRKKDSQSYEKKWQNLVSFWRATTCLLETAFFWLRDSVNDADINDGHCVDDFFVSQVQWRRPSFRNLSDHSVVVKIPMDSVYSISTLWHIFNEKRLFLKRSKRTRRHPIFWLSCIHPDVTSLMSIGSRLLDFKLFTCASLLRWMTRLRKRWTTFLVKAEVSSSSTQDRGDLCSCSPLSSRSQSISSGPNTSTYFPYSAECVVQDLKQTLTCLSSWSKWELTDSVVVVMRTCLFSYSSFVVTSSIWLSLITLTQDKFDTIFVVCCLES